MAQLSRPIQIALLAAAALVGVLLFTVTRSSNSTTGASTPAVSASAPATTAHTQGSASNGATSNHATGNSLGGLSHAINRAHHAAATSQQHEAHLAERSAQASNEATPTQPSSTATHAPAASATAATPPATSSPTKTSNSAPAKTTHKSKNPSGSTIPSGQRTVEAELAKGDVVVLLFWNPAGADDATVHSAVNTIASAHHRVAVQEATASQVANFGSITRGVQIYATPTILIINKQGKTLVLNGVQDAFSIEQAIAEAHHS
ncbi:MAG TPA: hypothetical protein VK680_06340 [Solirubrobacteraceae bacterium]|jgi:hypothetical protein|nr:hypothetical protein [Solirubrobacteraceae bacterium]